MNSWPAILPAIALLLVGCGGRTQRPDNRSAAADDAPGPGDEVRIRAVFQQYRQALLTTDGALAVATVDRRTIEWYDAALKDALSLNREALARLPFVRKFTVLRLRHEFDRRTLERMAGDALFAYAVEQGWIDKSSVEKAVLAQVETTGDAAHASVEGQPQTPVFFFSREEDGWHFALWRTFPIVDAAIAHLLKKSHRTEDDYCLKALQSLSTRQLDPAIFDGPRS
ncbi:MAG: hypothetical protein JXR37_10510 [Kiritimatiellae bacterium]|nr:hypothetical protein [Kiritimatiellia bacterium]